MTQISSPRSLIIGAFALIYLVWGSTYLSVALALGSIPPFLLMGSRSMLGGIALFAGARLNGSQTGTMADWARASVCGVLFFVGCHGILAYAQQKVPSGIAALLLATIPFWIALLEAVLPGGRRTSLQQMLLLVPGFAGVGLIVADRMGTDTSDITDLFLLLAAAASWALGTLLSRRWSPPDVTIEYSGMELISGGGVLLAISVLRHETTGFDLQAVTAKAFGGWLYLTVLGTIVTFAAYIWLLKRMPAKLVATYAFVNPVVAVILGWAVLGEKLTVSTLLGAALVVGSVAAALLTGEPEKAEPARAKAHGKRSMDVAQ
jgi:drug/metabolite transporter (DMT)-like permease